VELREYIIWLSGRATWPCT